jgi:hypothetical protein
LPQAKASGYKQGYPAACGGEDSFFIFSREDLCVLYTAFILLLFFLLHPAADEKASQPKILHRRILQRMLFRIF